MQRIIQVIVNVLPVNCNLCSFRLDDNCEILKLSIGHPYVDRTLDRRNSQCPLCLYGDRVDLY